MLGGDANRLFKRDGAFCMRAVEAVASWDPFWIDHVGRALAHVAEGLTGEIPCAVVIVLRTSSFSAIVE